MDFSALDKQIADLRGLMQKRLGAKGATLAAQVAWAGRRLPRRLRTPAQAMAQAETWRSHPKLARQIDTTTTDAAHRDLRDYLRRVDPTDRMIGNLLGVLGDWAFVLLLMGGVVMALAVWAGWV